MAAVSSLHITIHGLGGHAAFPANHRGSGAHLAKVICELQSIVSREMDPLDSAVISVTMLEAGTAFNVIPNSATARGTIRALTTARLQFIKQRIQELAEHVAAANRCRAEVKWPDMDYPATVNDEHCWDVVRAVGSELLGSEQVRQVSPVMGGEDFAFYNEAGVPGCFVGVGMRNEQIGATHFVHQTRFKVDEDAPPSASRCTLHSHCARWKSWRPRLVLVPLTLIHPPSRSPTFACVSRPLVERTSRMP